MFVARLLLSQFRNHADAVIEAGPGFVVLTGENGAGKTNVLEAVSLLAPGRGLRGALLSEMARDQGPGGFAVAARLSIPPARARGDRAALLPARDRRHEGDVDIGTGTSAAVPERRQVRINGAPASATSLGEWLSLLWLTPAMDRLFVEGASGRRRFLDRLVLALEPGHASHAARYEAAMRARNKLLAQEEEPDAAWLAALEAAMAEHGMEIAGARERTVALLAGRLAGQPEGPFARADIRLEGWHVPDEGPAYAAALRAQRPRDAGAGRTLEGPHRTDLAVAHADKGVPAASSSTGEQKALLLSILLAHAELVAERTGQSPVLLLDEVAAHLDPLRRAALFERLAATGGQIWITGTERALFEAVPGPVAWLHVEDGTLQAR